MNSRLQRALPIINIVTTVAVITINILANALPLNGLDTGEISDRFEIYFVPAGYVFSIWGLIYLGMIAFTVYQALPLQRDNKTVQSIGLLYALSGVGNITWIFLWHYEVFTLTLVPMLVILGSLIAIFLKIWAHRTELSLAERWTIAVPFSVYLGWISVATVANATQLLYYLDWGQWGLSAEVWAIVMLLIAAAIAVIMSIRHGNLAYAAVFVWAYVGIAIKHNDVNAVMLPAAMLAGIIALAGIAGVPLSKGRRMPQS
ncbi:MAG: tryptophan-rich sensory protein [Anaerolineae bacterium]|nr:tryptophan-rich sensory protein [Anaerolineae bacterium]